MKIDYPDYPCVAMESPNHRHSKSGTTKDEPSQHDIYQPTVVFYPVSAFDDLSHVDFCREYKSFAVLGYANLEKISERAPYKAQEVARMRRKLDSLTRPPELVRAERESAGTTKEDENVKSGGSKKGGA